MAYTTIDDPSAYFQTTIYSGTGSEQVITHGGNSDLQADWVWIKRRDATNNHRLTDVVRGATKEIYSDLADAEDTQAQGLKSFASDGFTLGTNAGYNADGGTYVAWNWKAGTSFTNDASSTSVGTIDSVGSVNTDAGFSIQTWTGTGSGGTIAHGLGAVPSFMIVKNRSDGGRNWPVYFGDRTKYMYLSSTDAQADAGTIIWNNTTPTSTVFSVGNDNGVNESGKNYVGYVFAEKQGYSKFGSYTGNGNADGTFIYTGFKPAWIMVKCSTTANSYDHWVIYDNKRLGYNIAGNRKIYANSNVAEPGDDDLLDILSNGFKFRNTHSNVNGSGETFIYMAFAESPFVTSTGIPTTAR